MGSKPQTVNETGWYLPFHSNRKNKRKSLHAVQNYLSASSVIIIPNFQNAPL
jgi:hypothetical protein